MASPSFAFRTSDPFAARQHALQWAYATWQDAGNSLRFSIRVALRAMEDYLG